MTPLLKRLPLILALGAAALAGGCKPTVSAQQVRAYLVSHPEMIEEAANAYNVKQQDKALAGLKAAVATHRTAIDRDPLDFVANPNGKVTVVEFFDFRCGYCKQIAPEVVKLIAANPDVRFVFKDFPIFGAESIEAAAIAQAARGEGKYLPLYSQFLQAQDLTEADMRRIVSAEGLDFDALRKKAMDPAISDHMQSTHDLAKTIGLDGTPQFVIDGEVVQGANLPALKAAIAKAKKA
jgi:protein-disulfide isomerase